MVRQQIITKNEDPMEWVNSSVVTKKKNNKIRVCIDPRYLNKFIIRKHKQLPTVDDILDKLSGSKYFSKFDCSSGFWTVQLDSESSKLCTFSTPFGNYSYKRLPFGLSVSTEAFQERMEETFSDIDNVQFYVDDLIIYASTVEEHNKVLLNVLKRAQECNVKFNREKSQVLCREISFLGMIVSDQGVKPDPIKVMAISELKCIHDKKELERFLGMTNYLSKFINNYSTITSPLRELLKKDILFKWLPSHENAFNKLKEALTNAPTLKLFDSNKDVVVSVDCSSEGVGACLLQDRQPIAYASKALTECQKGYAQVEREMFAIVFGCIKFHKYILGKHTLVETDHSALEILFKKPLSLVPARLQRMMLKIQGYDITVKYVPGKQMYISDFLSRSFLVDKNDETKEFDEEFNKEIVCHVEVMIDSLPISSDKRQLIAMKTNEDATLSCLKDYIHNGWPNSKNNLNELVKPFWNFRNELSLVDQIILRNNLIVIPVALQKMMLEIIHEGHLGLNTCLRRAKNVLFWPGLTSQIKELCNNCQTCALFRKNNTKEPIQFHDIPRLPWLKLGTDLFEFNKQYYLVVVDYYSKFFEVARLNDLSSRTIINHIKSMIARHGCPLEIVSDNGPQYSCKEFKEFADAYGFKHITSSPDYPKSNGLAESSVKIVKSILKKCKEDNTDPYIALLNFRNSPKENSPSPANLLFNRNLNDRCPVSANYLKPKIYTRNYFLDKELQHKVENHYDKTARSLRELEIGQGIMFKKKMSDDRWQKGSVVKKADFPRSYIVKDEQGRQYRRNRQHLRNINEYESTNCTENESVNPNSYVINYDSNDSDCESFYEAEETDDQELIDTSEASQSSTGINDTPEPNLDLYKTRSGRIVKAPSRLIES
ncbi:uncharacterized protein K02A2.6-like isoform X1 [Cydia fagiglandana]|uniref:uncharacterized protein K02A2.6-like isoform X1 n=1 Tax=Cydia fagiglandana TaxID=1458189 RepID=UPI002FEE4BBB